MTRIAADSSATCWPARPASLIWCVITLWPARHRAVISTGIEIDSGDVPSTSANRNKLMPSVCCVPVRASALLVLESARRLIEFVSRARSRAPISAGDFGEQALILDQLVALREGQILGVTEDHLLAPLADRVADD